MGHHELSIIENVMAHKIVNEFGDLFAEFLRLAGQLCERLRQPVCDLNVATSQLPHEFHVVIARHTQRRTARDGIHHQLENLRNLWSTIHQVANEHDSPAIGSLNRERGFIHAMSKLSKEINKFIKTAVNVADDVEWPM